MSYSASSSNLTHYYTKKFCFCNNMKNYAYLGGCFQTLSKAKNLSIFHVVSLISSKLLPGIFSFLGHFIIFSAMKMEANKKDSSIQYTQVPSVRVGQKANGG